MIRQLFLLSSFLFVGACSSHPVLPKTSDIKVSREAPSKNCQDLGPLEGRSTKVNGTAEDAMLDLKNEAIRKGANYVKIETMGALGSSLRGQAFFCN